MPLPGQSELVPIRTQQVPQSVETPVTFAPVPGAYVRFAYSRSSDSMASQIDGQDYLCFKHNDQRLVFVVADGVGSSFCGNLAARILGDNLLDWLWSLDIGYLGGEAALSEAATSFLNRLQKTAQREVEEYEIPDLGSPLITQALEAQRAYGSEAIFAACRIDHPGPVMPEGLIALFWMGDTQIRVLDEDGAEMPLGGSFDNANRWSTSQGARGALSAWMRPLSGVGRVSAFSDGLSAHADGLLTYPDATLDREIHQGARLPTSDDVAFIDVVLRTPVYEGYPDPALPDPNLERPHLEPIWNPTGQDTYELRWSWPGGRGKVSFIVQEATNPALLDARTYTVPQGESTWRPPEPREPGHYYYRVRAMKQSGGLAPRSELTPWSELRQAKVAYPPPPAPLLRLVETSGAPVLEWEGEGEALDYTLERATTPEFSDVEIVYEGRGTSWAVPTGKPGSYFFRARAISDGGPGPWSEPLPVEVVMPPPPVPHLATISYGYARGEYELRWQGVPRATHYELEETALDGEGEPVIVLVDDTSYHVEEQAVGRYRYRVRACHDFGASEWSAEQVAAVAPRPPTTAPDLTLEGPEPDSVEPGKAERYVVRLRWTEVPEATEYLVEASEDESFESALVHTTADLGLEMVRREPGTLAVRVCGVNSGGEGPWSSVARAAIAPPAPDWIETTPSTEGALVALSWGASGGRATYRVEMAGETLDWQTVYTGPDTQCEAGPLAGQGPLRFRVRAELPGVESGWVTSKPVETQADQPTPRLDTPEVEEAGQLRLRWSAVPDADGYQVEVARDEGFTSPRTMQIDATGISFWPPASGAYWFRVRAIRRRPDGVALDAPGEAISMHVRRPAAPRLWPLDPVQAGMPFTVAWTGLPSSIYYELQESTSVAFEPGATWAMRIFHPEQKADRPGRPAGKVYFRIKAVDQDNQASPWSTPLTVEVQ